MTDRRRDPFPPLPVAGNFDTSQIGDLGTTQFRGDIRAYAWNGGGDLSTGFDLEATAGYFLDSSEGSAQFMGDVFVGGEIIAGDPASNTVIIGGATGTLEWSAVGEAIVPTNGSFSQVADTFDTDQAFARLQIIGYEFTTGNDPGPRPEIFVQSTSDHAGASAANGTYMTFGFDLSNDLRIEPGFMQINAELLVNNTLSEFTAIEADSDITTAGRFLAANGGVGGPTHTFTSDTGLGWYRAGANNMFAASNGAAQFGINNVSIQSPNIRDNTTANAANVHITSTGSGDIQRSTSSARYKSRITYNVDYLADIDLKPVKFYSKNDSRWFYGLVAEDVHEADNLLSTLNDDGEVEGYDIQEILAVLVAKVNRHARLLEAA